MNIHHRINNADHILKQAYQHYKPVAIVALSSLGHDSQASTQVASEFFEWYAPKIPFHVVTLDTGVSADGYIEWVQNVGHRLWDNFHVWGNHDVGFQWYVDNAIDYGFGYTRQMHTEQYYRMLKERTIDKVKKHFKALYGIDRYSHIMFISGIYKAESVERQHTATESRKIGSAVWVSPLLHWQKTDIAYYRQMRDLPDNPFYETVGGSGDCQCNWGNFIELNDLEKHSPVLALKLAILERAVMPLHKWGWNESPSKGLIAERNGQMVLPIIEPLCAPNLCDGCERPKQGESNALDDMTMQRFDWSA